MPKATTKKSPYRHNPLEADILATGPLRETSHKKRKSRDLNESEAVSSKQARTVLDLSRELAEDEDVQEGLITSGATPDAFGLESRFVHQERDAASDEEEVEEYEEWSGFDGEDVGDNGQEAEVDPRDRETFNKFFPAKQEDDLLKFGLDGRPKNAPEEPQGESRNLADIIMQKIEEAEERQRMKQMGEGTAQNDPEELDEPLDPRIVESFEKLGAFLSRYKSGKLPKLFKYLPKAPRWEEMVEISNPSEWSPHAIERGVRLFVSANTPVATVFIEMVLLPRFREEMHDNGKIHRQIYLAIEKSLFRADAFFIGFLFPLVFSGTCTTAEAKVVSSILKQNKIPVLSGCVALQKMCEYVAEEASKTRQLHAASNMMVKAIIEKQYAMPYQVVDSLVFHFLRSRSMDPASIQRGASKEEIDARALRNQLPLVWHETFLSFVELYKNDITEDQREALLDLLQSHGHPKYAPDIRRELLAGRGRGVPVAKSSATPRLDGDDTMMVDSF